MALGFRKSIFGYNCEEVSEYIHKTDAAHKQTISALNEKIKGIEDELYETHENVEKLNRNIEETTQSLNYYKAKYEEVKTLSENIGKLYLVAQTNAKAVIAAADKARAASEEEINENIAVITNTNEALNDIKSQILSMSDTFVKEINQLTTSLEQIKAAASSASKSADVKINNFEQIYHNITNN